MTELLSTMLENLIYDITTSAIKKRLDRYRLKRFIKMLRKDISAFCEKNESIYIDSSAFDYFIRNTDFLNKVIERSIATKLEKGNKEFLRDEIKKAREIAVAEGVTFANSEERVIKDLYHLIMDRVGTYYRNSLSVEQRHMVSICMNQFAELEEAVNANHKEDCKEHREILNAIKEGGKLSNTKAALIADLLSKELYEGRIQEFDDLAIAVKDKSDDLSVFYDCLSQILRSERCADAVKRIADISDVRIRDNAVRTVLPLLLFRDEAIDGLMEAITVESLRNIVDSLISGNNERIFSEEITLDGGLEIHNFTLNKKLVYEEERLIKLIVILSLYEKRIRNIHFAMEEVGKGKGTWFTDILTADKRIEDLIIDNADDNSQELTTVITQILQYKEIYDGLCKKIRSFYYSVLIKAYLLMDKIDVAEKYVPKDLMQERPLSDYVYAIKIEKREVGLNEIYDYSVRNEAYWLLNNYFVSSKNEKEIIDFCREHEEIFEKDWSLFFVYQGALKVLGLNDEREFQLKKHSDELSNVYEYWNELLNLSDLEENQKAFVEACRDGKMTSLFSHSAYLIIERLLNFHEYDLAELYVKKHEKIGEKGFKIKKYKAIILQGKKNDVEALKWYRAAFEDNSTDEFVIDSLITLSLVNKRKVSKEVLNAAIKVDTSRLHMLAAACYLNEGDISRAKSENIRAILMSRESYNPAFGQYIEISTSIHSNEAITITGIEADTAACCKKNNGSQRWLCVYKDCILPTSPYVWNNDYHVHIDDAARLGFLRKHTGNQITIDNDLYVITDIVPLDCYLFRTCIAKMTQNGFAKELSIPVQNGKMDSSAFTEMISQITPDERQSVDWLEQYNNIQEVPLPLYTYKRFTHLTYFQFVDVILSSHDYFVRQMVHASKPAEKYVISFSALVALYKAGYPADKIGESGGTIMESTLVQADSDVAEVIKEYNRDTVAFLGVMDEKLFINQVDEGGKDYWLKEAGGFKKYCEAIPTVKSDQDLSGEFFGKFDSKELFGICDYDAIAFVQHNEEYSLVIIEAILASLSQNELVNLNVISVSDWLVRQKVDDTRLIGYLQSLLDEGCLMSVTKDVIDYMSLEASKKDSVSKQRMYLMWDDLLSRVDNFPDKQKEVFIQAVSEIVASFEDEVRNIDKGILHVLTTNILLFRKQKIEMFIDAAGRLSFSVVNIESEEQMVEVEDK
ncbi:hypothetical protein [Claveliimonas bilis]|uniref:Uncharacterized protein n=1 Tax=Claveliimonas bilis TaxID=3028070 RepID=A0ABN6YXK2_9FIRM|nr:hypothetical protein [Claveliimonas bilis]BDZ76119.1 hypothetical protein Lac1_03020 [Claveliimonas bilis]